MEWLGVQHEYLSQLKGSWPHLPIVYAGDIFDKPSPPLELINWTLKHLPRGYAVPGQHDLMHHELKDVRKTAYEVLCQAGVLKNLRENDAQIVEYAGVNLALIGYPWRARFDKRAHIPDDCLSVAVCHRYVWSTRHNAYEGAHELNRVDALPASLSPFDFVVFGDNHKGFESERMVGTRRQQVFNCGTFIRRKMDEKMYRPGYGVIYSDGSIERVYFHVKDDKFVPRAEEFDQEEVFELEQFMEELKALGQGSLDFRNAVTSFLNNNDISPRVRNLVLRTLETSDD